MFCRLTNNMWLSSSGSQPGCGFASQGTLEMSQTAVGGVYLLPASSRKRLERLLNILTMHSPHSKEWPGPKVGAAVEKPCSRACMLYNPLTWYLGSSLVHLPSAEDGPWFKPTCVLSQEGIHCL